MYNYYEGSVPLVKIWQGSHTTYQQPIDLTGNHIPQSQAYYDWGNDPLSVILHRRCPFAPPSQPPCYILQAPSMPMTMMTMTLIPLMMLNFRPVVLGNIGGTSRISSYRYVYIYTFILYSMNSCCYMYDVCESVECMCMYRSQSTRLNFRASNDDLHGSQLFMILGLDIIFGSPHDYLHLKVICQFL